MWKLFKAIRKLYLFAACDHFGTVRSIVFDDSYELRFCRHCGRVLSWMCENDHTHNPHLLYPLLDFTQQERGLLVKAAPLLKNTQIPAIYCEEGPE